MKLLTSVLGLVWAQAAAQCPQVPWKTHGKSWMGLHAKHRHLQRNYPYSECMVAVDNPCHIGEACRHGNMDVFPYGQDDENYSDFGCQKRRMACQQDDRWIQQCCDKHFPKPDSPETPPPASPNMPLLRPLVSADQVTGNADEDRSLRGHRDSKSKPGISRLSGTRDLPRKKNGKFRRGKFRKNFGKANANVVTLSKPMSVMNPGISGSSARYGNGGIRNPFAHAGFGLSSSTPSRPTYRVQGAPNRGRRLPVGILARSMPPTLPHEKKDGRAGNAVEAMRAPRVGSDHKDHNEAMRRLKLYRNLADRYTGKRAFQIKRKARKAQCLVESCRACNSNSDSNISSFQELRGFFGPEGVASAKCAPIYDLIDRKKVVYRTKEFKDFEDSQGYKDCWSCVKAQMEEREGCQVFKNDRDD